MNSMESKNKSFGKNARLALLSAFFVSLALPYIGWSFLVWFALVPLFFALRRERSLRFAILLTLIFGVFYFIAIIAPLFELNDVWWGGGLGVYHGIFAMLFLALVTALYGAIFFVPVAYVIHRYRTATMPGIFLAALTWSIFEYIRSHYGLAGYDGGTLGYALLSFPYLRESAYLFGVGGLSFLIVLVNILLVLVYERMEGKTFAEIKRVFVELFSSTRDKYWMFLFLFVFLCIIGAGVIRNETNPPYRKTPLHVGVVVANSEDQSVGGGLYRAYREKMIMLLRAHPETNIILFPENTFPFFAIDENTKMLALEQPVALDDREMLYGDFLSMSKKYSTTTFAIGLHTVNKEKKYNTLVFYRDGVIIGMLHKERLVPFFEYVPFGLPIRLFETLTPGELGQKIEISGDTMSLLMCSEVSDRSITPSGVSLILAPSNDSVFTRHMAGSVHDTFARMRAIESGAYLVRANRGSVSSIVNPKGEVLKTDFGDTVLFATLY